MTAPFIGAMVRDGVVREARTLMCMYVLVAVVAVAAGSAAPVYYWLLPVLLGQPFLSMILLSEHTGCALTDDMRSNSQTTFDETGDAATRVEYAVSYRASCLSGGAVSWVAGGASADRGGRAG